MTGSEDPGDKYFYNRDVFTWKFSTQWLAAKRQEDDCGGLWRIQDDLYDLTGWEKHHPGEARPFLPQDIKTLHWLENLRRPQLAGPHQGHGLHWGLPDFPCVWSPAVNTQQVLGQKGHNSKTIQIYFLPRRLLQNSSEESCQSVEGDGNRTRLVVFTFTRFSDFFFPLLFLCSLLQTDLRTGSGDRFVRELCTCTVLEGNSLQDFYWECQTTAGTTGSTWEINMASGGNITLICPWLDTRSGGWVSVSLILPSNTVSVNTRDLYSSFFKTISYVTPRSSDCFNSNFITFRRPKGENNENKT